MFGILILILLYISIHPILEDIKFNQYLEQIERENIEYCNNIKEYFAKTNIYTKEKCKDCWAKFFCSGGCNANSWQYEGDIAKPHKISCELEKKRVECALMIKAATLQ